MEGTRIGVYQVESELGSGGMGTVWRATVTGKVQGLEAGDRVALKIIHPHLLEKPGFFKRFLREAEIGRSVRHENVVRTFDADALLVEGQQRHFLVMEYAEGQTLRELSGDLEQVPEELCRHIGREVARGLAAIHEAGAVHRDLKPENILITPDHAIKIMDLGVARLADEAIRLSVTGGFVGSVLYASPEQFTGQVPDGRSDLFALGILLYELSCGVHPHAGDDFPQVLAKVVEEKPRRLGDRNLRVSPFFEEVVHCLLAKDPEERFSSATELLSVLEQGEVATWWGRRAQAIREATRAPLRRIQVARETAVYGREEELVRLRRLYGQAAEGEGQVVLVEGEAGVGKTRLVDELVARLRQDGEELSFLIGAYPPGGAATAAGAFSTAYREHFGPAGSAAHLPETPILVAAFDALLRGEPPPSGVEPLTRESIQTLFVHATRALAAERPTVVVIEDLHFAPEEGLGLFASLALAVPGHRVLLIATTRPGLSEAWKANLERLAQVSWHPLERLGPRDLADLLADAFRSKQLADDLGMRIARKSDGNPFFVFEIIRGLREGRFIARGHDGVWSRTQVIRDIAIPSTVQDLVRARIADLDDEDRNLLEVVSCCGFEFDPLLAGEVLGLPRIPLLQRLGGIEKRHRLVRSAGVRFAFDHHQVREALYDGISELLKREYHGAIAEAMEAREGGAEGASVVDICEHYLTAGQGERALSMLDAALDHLEKSHLNDPAARLARRALDAEGLLQAGRRAEILLRLSCHLDFLGHIEEETEVLEEAIALADEDGDPLLRAKANQDFGHLLVRVARRDEAKTTILRAIDLAREAGDRQVEGRASSNLANLYLTLGRHEEALAHFEKHLRLAREEGDRYGEGIATGNLGVVYLSRGPYAKARDHLEEALEISSELGQLRPMGSAVGNLGSLATILGRYEEALQHFERRITIAQEIGDRRGKAIGLVNRGRLFRELGENAEARESLERSISILEEIGDRATRVHALDHLGGVAAQTGDLDEAERLYQEALDLSRELGYVRGIVALLVDLGALASRREDAEGARQRLEEALDLERKAGHGGAAVMASAWLARLGFEDPARALELYRRQEDRLPRYTRLRTRFLHWQATNDPEHLADAHHLLGELRDHAPEACRERLIENVPLHRDIMAAWEEHGEGSG